MAMLAASYLMVARSCGYDHFTLLIYASYVGLYVWLPGCLLLASAQTSRPSFLEMVALGLPLGFAAEISVFLAASAAHAKWLLPFTPIMWVGLGAIRFPLFNSFLARRQNGVIDRGTPATFCAVAGLVLALIFTVVSHLYAESPFAEGVLGSSTHHDWIYLLSRAAEIKTRWPLQDPSMAGEPLSYHYFLLVHLASASLVTGIKLEMLGLRLYVLPLGAALLAQSLTLGRLMTRSVWGGILSAVLLLTANELCLDRAAPDSAFASNFLPWLFISPTFFFGMVFSGALILWIYRLLIEKRLAGSDWLVLALLATIGTGAKGTVVPPLILALSIWFVFEAIRNRRFPTKTAAMILALAVGFSAVYFTVLVDWGTGAARFAPLASMKLSRFWQEHVGAWQLRLEGFGITPTTGRFFAKLGGVAVVVIGYSGVRLLGWVAVWTWKRQRNPTLALWLGLTAFVYFVFGNLLQLDSDAQLYLLYPVRLPKAALSAAVLLGVFARVRMNVREFGGLNSVYGRGTALLFFTAAMCVGVAAGTVSWWTGVLLVNVAAFLAAPSKQSKARFERNGFGLFLWRTAPLLFVVALTVVQIDDWRRHNSQGFHLWLTQSDPHLDKNVALLRNAMDWIRVHTPKDSVFVANAFSDRNLKSDSVAQLDRTTVDKYYYYSALAERRLWVEGPTYLRAQDEAARRVAAASSVFYAGAPVSVLLSEKLPPNYVLIDRMLKDGASVRLPRGSCVFENARISLYRISAPDKAAASSLVSATDNF